MKKIRFAFFAMLAIGSLASCKKEGVKVIPEGTADVAIEEDDFEVTSDNITNLTQYAKQVADLLTADSESLRNAWEKSYKDGEAYAESFKKPGEGKTYKSYANCIQQIIEGCVDIAGEVGNAKIGDPRALWEAGEYTAAVYAVESWYSYHSIDDYANNIRSIRNAFNGTRDASEGENSIASYLKANNETLYQQTKDAINNALTAIESMAAPFRSHIGNNSVITAQNACASLEYVLDNNLKPYMSNIDDEDALKSIVVDYVDNVVLPTYVDLDKQNKELNKAVRNLANNPSSAAFEAAANAWMAARLPWESSEAFLFGPVAEMGLDPNMDSWPLDSEALKNILIKGNYEATSWEGEYNEDDETIEAAQNVRGFHTLEFLLFKNGVPRVYNN